MEELFWALSKHFYHIMSDWKELLQQMGRLRKEKWKMMILRCLLTCHPLHAIPASKYKFCEHLLFTTEVWYLWLSKHLLFLPKQIVHMICRRMGFHISFNLLHTLWPCQHSNKLLILIRITHCTPKRLGKNSQIYLVCLQWRKKMTCRFLSFLTGKHLLHKTKLLSCSLSWASKAATHPKQAAFHGALASKTWPNTKLSPNGQLVSKLVCNSFWQKISFLY